MQFSEWFNQLDEALKKPKVAAVAHTDIDRWLKSVDGLAKDLNKLKSVKKKAQDKLDQVTQKYNKPENKPKDDEEENDDEEKPLSNRNVEKDGKIDSRRKTSSDGEKPKGSIKVKEPRVKPELKKPDKSVKSKPFKSRPLIDVENKEDN